MSPKLQRLADELQTRFRQKTPGHCLRVDDLSLTECIDLRTQLQTVSLNFSPHILEHDLTTDQAIEKRNLQQESLCLLIPSGTTHAAISSLGNSFEQFDTAYFLEKLECELLKTIPADLQGAVNQSLKQAKYRRKIQVEDRTDFLSAILEQPTLENVGASLWQIGLIPDKSTDFTDRLKLNYDCIQALAHPLKPHTTVRQRLETTKLRKREF